MQRDMDGFNFQSPDYVAVFHERKRRLTVLREDIKRGGKLLPSLQVYYKTHTADFVNDWGVTFDPRNVGTEKPAYLPFILFPRQRAWVDWLIGRWRDKEPGVSDKSRDMGLSWLSVSTASTLCLFYENMAIGFGSRKEEYVDKLGDPKCLFWKARMFIEGLPPEFTGTWQRERDAPHMRINFPDTNSFITGESGDNIGRGDRTGIHFVDESAYLERPHLIEASLSQTTNCRIDISSANGMANPFAEKRHKWDGTARVFTFHWRDDPRKDESIKDKDGLSWYEKQVRDLDPVVLAQEVDINYSASVEGIVIPNAWVQASVDAHIKLGIVPTGSRFAALDVADEGVDKNALCGAHGIVIEHLEEWSGKNSDIYQTTVKAFGHCDVLGYSSLTYDADGLGAGVRGDARAINEIREREGNKPIAVEAFRGSAKVINPKREDEPGRKNENYFANRKAQAWWSSRRKFERTYQVLEAIKTGKTVEQALEVLAVTCDDLVSLASVSLGAALVPLTRELSQPTYTRNEAGKIVINKMPEGMSSPNKADAVNMRLSSATLSEGFFAQKDMLAGAQPVDLPAQCDAVFATVFLGVKPGKDNDGAGVIYWARSKHAGHPLIVVDWDLAEIGGDVLDKWLPGIFARLKTLTKTTKAIGGSLGAWIEDNDAGKILCMQAERKGLPARPIDTKLADVSAADRAINVSGYVRGQKVKFSNTAFTRTKDYKGSNANHLKEQLSSFYVGSEDAEMSVLLNCFTHGVAIALGSGDGV